MCRDGERYVGNSLGRRCYLALLLSEDFPEKMISSSYILRNQELEGQEVASPVGG